MNFDLCRAVVLTVAEKKNITVKGMDRKRADKAPAKSMQGQ